MELATTVKEQDADLANTEYDVVQTEPKLIERKDSAAVKHYIEQLHRVSPDAGAFISLQILSLTEPLVQDTHVFSSRQIRKYPTVQVTTDVTKIQQCHSKELQFQDTAVSMAPPTAT